VAAVSVGAAGAASAQGFGGGDFYLKGFGGWTIPQNNNFNVTDKASGDTGRTGFDYDTGYTLGAAAGYAISPNVAFELEYAYRNASADLKNSDTSGDVTSNAIMANAIYTFEGMGPNAAFKPYLGAGLGAADLSYNPKGFGDLSGNYQFAYQVITGVGYELNPNWTLNGEVRYFGIADEDLENSSAKLKSSFNTFDALVGVTYHF
jgi:opacity protein-like surface antigen